MGVVAILALISSLIALAVSIAALKYNRKKHNQAERPQTVFSTFSVSDYLERTEKAYLEILENQEPVDTTIVLWWGLDGLRLNKDGTTEWISRKKKKEPVNFYLNLVPDPSYIPALALALAYPVFNTYNPCNNIVSQMSLLDIRNATQSTRAQIDQLHNSMMQNTLQSIGTAQYTGIYSMMEQSRD